MIVFDFYPITSVTIILLAVLNDLPIMAISYDNTWLDPKPVRWDMRRVLTLATALGLVGVVQTFGILVIAKVWLKLNNEQIQSFIYLKLALAGHLSLLVARTRKPLYSKPYPAPILLGAILATQIAATLVVGFGLLVTPLPWSYIGLIWAYCLGWVVITDNVKLSVYRHLDLSAPRHRSFLNRIQESIHPFGGLHGGHSRKTS
jgi:H+-transporting ATPase